MPFISKFIFLSLLTSSVLGQSFFKKVEYQAESGINFSTSGKTPFLIRANQYGIIPLESSILTIRGGAYKEYDSTFNSRSKFKKLKIGFGINTVANVGKINQLLLPEAYIKIRYRVFELYSGRKKEIVGLVDTVLTSGSYIWSGNALPLPKVQIAIPNYISVIGKGLLSIKGAFSHGWFDNGAVQNFYLHQKYLYARIGKPNWRVKLYSGFNHQVQWSGQPSTPYIDKITGNIVKNFPSDFNTYLKVVLGKSLNKNDKGLATGVPGNEALNRAGNHLGTIDIATEFRFRKFDILLYRQSIYEDGSLFFLNNIEDGLFGFSIKRKKAKRGITQICFEYMNTMGQGGRPEDRYDDIPQLRGVDNYFNNGIYTDSWTYKHNVIGTSLLMPINSIDKNRFTNINLEEYSANYILNRVETFSFSIGGTGKNIKYYSRLVVNHNFGTYLLPINRTQFSFLHKINYNFPKFSVVSCLALDQGGLFSLSLGGYLGIQRTFF